jgi:hypothetical protein
MISQIYYPKYNIVLINSNDIFINAFVCFLDNIYVTSPANIKETKILLNNCLYTYFLNILQNTSSSYSQYNNIVFYYNLNLQYVNIEIFKYICKDKFINIIKQFITKNKNIFLFFKNNKNLNFNNSLIPKVKITGEEQEILNAINKKLASKPTLT